MTLSASGILSGIPAATTATNFTVKVADSDAVVGAADEGTKALSLRPLPADIAASSSPLKVVVLGASTPACKNLDAAHGYNPADCWTTRYGVYLATIRPGSTLVNLAIAGTGTCGALPTGFTIPSICSQSGSANAVPTPHPIPDTAHNITAALALNPNLIIVNYAGDDKIGVDNTITNLHTLQDAATAANVPMWIANAQPDAVVNSSGVPDAADIALTALRKDQRDKTNAGFPPRIFDFFTVLADPSGQLKPSYVNINDSSGHPNDQGHAAMYNEVVAKLPLH